VGGHSDSSACAFGLADTPELSEGLSSLNGRFVDACGRIYIVYASIGINSSDDACAWWTPAAPAVHDVVFDKWLLRPSVDGEI